MHLSQYRRYSREILRERVAGKKVKRVRRRIFDIYRMHLSRNKHSEEHTPSKNRMSGSSLLKEKNLEWNNSNKLKFKIFDKWHI